MLTYFPSAAGINNRYKDTDLIRVDDPTAIRLTVTDDSEFALFVPPVEFASFLSSQVSSLIPGSYSVYTVVREDVGFPDRIAWLSWGIGNEIYWWIIALVNGILDTEDLFPGQQLIVPSYALLQTFLSRTGNGFV